MSFALNDKPLSADSWFSTQHLVASVTVPNTDEDHTFNPPYVPEWNEFFARTMHFEYNKLRIEPERIGIIIDAADHASFVNGLPVGALVEKLFNSIGMQSQIKWRWTYSAPVNFTSWRCGRLSCVQNFRRAKAVENLWTACALHEKSGRFNSSGSGTRTILNRGLTIISNFTSNRETSAQT